MEDESIITLNDDLDNEIKFTFLDLVPYEGNDYIVLCPVDGPDNEVIILRVEEIDEENEGYMSVEDQETLDAVFNLFVARNE